MRASGGLRSRPPDVEAPSFPAAGFVVLAKTLEPQAMLDAMRLGITEWLPDPVKAADLDAALQRRDASVDRVGERQGRSPSSGGKGGRGLAPPWP